MGSARAGAPKETGEGLTVQQEIKRIDTTLLQPPCCVYQ